MPYIHIRTYEHMAKDNVVLSTDHSDVTVPSYGGHQDGSTDRTPPQQDPAAHSPTLTQPYTSQ